MFVSIFITFPESLYSAPLPAVLKSVIMCRHYLHCLFLKDKCTIHDWAEFLERENKNYLCKILEMNSLVVDI